MSVRFCIGLAFLTSVCGGKPPVARLRQPQPTRVEQAPPNAAVEVVRSATPREPRYELDGRRVTKEVFERTFAGITLDSTRIEGEQPNGFTAVQIGVERATGRRFEYTITSTADAGTVYQLVRIPRSRTD